jgi:hypothetical protein
LDYLHDIQSVADQLQKLCHDERTQNGGSQALEQIGQSGGGSNGNSKNNWPNHTAIIQ